MTRSDRRRRSAFVLALIGGLAVGPLPGTAEAAGPAAFCSMQLGSVTAAGEHRGQGILATSPPTMLGDAVGPADIYAGGVPRLVGPMAHAPVAPTGELRGGWLILGPSMYLSGYITDSTGHATLPDSAKLQEVSTGWEDITAFQTSRYYEGPKYRRLRMNQYALRNDGVLLRWTIDGDTWRDQKLYRGFASVKTFTLISQTRAYDSFLANTFNGALYTIRIPIDPAATPVVRALRGSSWEDFDTLIAERCGQHGTILLGIDQDTHTGHLYALSHADGAVTTIQSLGDLPVSLDDPAYFRWYLDTPQASKLHGE